MAHRYHAHATTKISSDKRGNPRIWLEGRKLERAGFAPQARYRMTIDRKNMRIELKVDPTGERIVSRRNRHGSETPIVDIVNAGALTPLKTAEILRIDFSTGIITIEPSARDARKIRRESRTLSRVKNKDPLRTGSVSTGLGILSHALHDGLKEAGHKTHMAFSVEIDPEYQDLCAARNPAWDTATIAINMPLQEFAFDPVARQSIEEVDILEAGIPCTAHSIAGRSKKHLDIPESDPVAGHLVVGFLAIVATTNPTVIIVENVPQYASSASFCILSNQLKEWGYDVEHTILHGEDFGCLEHRHRMALIATSKGMDASLKEQIEMMAGDASRKTKIADILENIPDDSPLWSEMRYLKDKEQRDREAGKGFRMQVLDKEDTKVGTIGRGYAKIRSTEPKLRHPNKPDLMRQFTPIEHARIKGIPEAMIEGLSVTTAHEMLGQSIVAAPFHALGKALGHELNAWSGKKPRRVRTAIINENDDRASKTIAPSSPSQLALF